MWQSDDGQAPAPLMQGPEELQERLVRATFSDQVARRIMVAIGDEGLQPGDLLPSEARLAGRYGVSRGVVREALRVLQASGVVRVASGQRAVVRPVTAELLRVYLHWAVSVGVVTSLEAFELRRGIERQSAALAAERITPAVATQLRAISARMRESISDPERYVDLDFSLHLAIASASGNVLIWHLIASAEPVMKEVMRWGMRTMAGDPSLLQAMHRRHEETIDAIVRRDAEGARNAIINEADHAIERLTRGNPDGDWPAGASPTVLVPHPAGWLSEEPETLPGRIARDIMSSIVREGLAPNALLPPAAELASTYNVSRGVIREALSVLSALSIVRTASGKGTSVEPLSAEPLSTFLRWALQMQAITQAEIHELRVGIEGECASLASQRITPDEECGLAGVVKLMGDDFADPTTLSNLDLRLHLTVAAAAHSRLLEHVVISFQQVICDLIVAGIHAMGGDLNRLRSTYLGHKAVADAVIAHRPETAREALERTLRAAIRHLDRAASYTDAARTRTEEGRK